MLLCITASVTYDLTKFLIDKAFLFPFGLNATNGDKVSFTFYYFKSWTRISPYIYGVYLGIEVAK